MKRVITLLLLISLCYSGFSKDINSSDLTLSGIVYSKVDSLSLSGASIELLTSDSSIVSRSISDLNGRFAIKCNINSNYSPTYLLKISYIGHMTFYTSIKGELSKSIDLGNIFLFSDNSLSEVVVSADNMIYKVDRTIIIPTKTEIKASSNSVELIGNLNLPGLMTNIIEQKISINGLGAIYQINGREQSREQFLAINPEDILRIEYYDSASARYINQNVGGIINLILKKKLTGGDVFMNAITSPVTGFLNGTAKASYNVKDSEFSLLYNNNLRDYSKRKTYLEESYINNLDTIYRENNGLNAPFGYVSQNIDLSYTYKNKRSMLNAIFRNMVGYQHDENRWNVFESEFNNQRTFHRNSNYEFNSYSPALDVYFSYQIKDGQSIEANLVGTLLNSYYNRRLLDDDVVTTHNRVDNRKRSIIGEVLHKKAFKNLAWNIGFKHQASYTKNIYTNGTDDITRMNINDSYLYTQITGKINNLSYDLGSGLKIYNVNNKSNRKSYIRNLTTVNLMLPIYKDLRLSYRFQLSPNLPSLSQMSDVLQYYDNLTGLKGNPNLKSYNSIMNRFLFIYTKKKFRANFWLSYYTSDNPIALSTYYNADKKIFISEYLNQKKNDKINAQIDLSLNSLLNHINISISGGWQKFTSKGQNYNHSLYNLYWSANVAAYYKKFSLSMAYTRPQKTLSAEYISLAENYSSVMLMYKHRQLSLNLGVFYPFTKDWKSSSWSISKVNPSYKHVRIRNNGNMIVAGFSYYFNFGRSFKTSKKGVNNMDSETGILKVE